MRAMRALFGFGFGGSVRRGTAAAACHPKLASSCRRVAMSPLGGLGLARSRARGELRRELAFHNFIGCKQPYKKM